MGNDHSLAQKNGHTYWLVGAGAVLFILGGVFTWWTVLRADRQLREVLLQQTRLVALALNVEHVQALSGDAADLGNPNYQRLKEQFAAIKQSSDRCRFVYLLGRRLDGRVFFLVDNEPPNSKDYSPPGQVYEEASDAIHRVFVSEAESVAGPQEDRWGVWVTALVPLRDRQTGRLVAVLGMDVDARAWRQTVLLAAAWPVGSMLAALALLILSVFLARSRRKILSHQEALRAKTEELERYFSQSLDLLCLASTDGRFLRLNPEWERTLGYSIGELENRAFLDFVHPDDLAATREAVSRLSDQETILNFENRYRHQDGSYRWIEWRSIPQGNLIYAAARDVTERKRTEQELRESRERLELALEAANDGLWDWDIAQDKVFFDSRYYTLSGYEPNEFPQRFEEWSKRVHPDDLGRCQEAIQAHLNGKTRVFDIEFRFLRKDGSWMWIRGRGKAVRRDASGAVLRMIGTHTDVTERKQAESALRESEERFSKSFRANPAPMVISEIDTGRFIDVNERWLAMLGHTREETIGHTSKELGIWNDPDHRDRVIRQLRADGYIKDIPTVFRTKSGEIRTTLWSAEKIALGNREVMLSLILDTTERQRAEEEREKLREQLTQAQKMESVGRLAGGVAHDFNNMLSVILGHTELALENLEPGQPLYLDLQEVRKAAERSAALTRQLLAFARKQSVDPKVLDLNETVEGMLKMLRRLIGEDIELSWRPGEDLPPVKMDPSQIDQILANLCVNARDAIDHSTGKVTIETGRAEFDQSDCAARMDAAPGVYVLIAVSDNGCGMSEETKAHVFEPFFTTKTQGEGTGLGLATVYGIVRQNRGFINVYSEVGRGTTFRIYFPACSEGVRDAAWEKQADVLEGHETILLVEDEPSILSLAIQMLERLGYRTLAASTPGEALRLAREHPGEIHLLITDVVMPEMNGRELAQRLLALHPRLKRLFMSGYTADVIAHQGVLDKGVNFMQKPFSFQVLSTKVREALES